MILTRHAESEWNRHYGRTRIDPGIPDPPLTERGIAQAEALGSALAGEGLRRIVSSPYRRALETATILGRAVGLPITVEPLVRERCAFSCDIGTPAAQLAALWPELSFDHLEDRWWGTPIEPEASLLARCATFRAESASLADRRHVLVVSHWGFIRGMTGEELANGAHLRLP